LGTIKSTYCFANQNNVLVGDARCKASVDIYEVPLDPGEAAEAEAAQGPATVEGALSTALVAKEDPSQPTAKVEKPPVAVTPAATGLEAALGAAVTPEKAAKSEAIVPAPAERKTPSGQASVSEVLGAALQGGG